MEGKIAIANCPSELYSGRGGKGSHEVQSEMSAILILGRHSFLRKSSMNCMYLSKYT